MGNCKELFFTERRLSAIAFIAQSSLSPKKSVQSENYFRIYNDLVCIFSGK